MKMEEVQRIQEELIGEEINIPDAELARLLGYPRGTGLGREASRVARETRQWYRDSTGPRLSLRAFPLRELKFPRFQIASATFESLTFADRLRRVEANAVVVGGFSAGRRVTPEVQRLWNQDSLNESYVLDAYASAVVEQLLQATYLRLCQRASAAGLAVLPHYSPGYDDWDLSQQGALFRLLKEEDPRLEIDLLDSGMLSPEKSLLAVFGVTVSTDLAAAVVSTPCERCLMKGCSFRRSKGRPEVAGVVESSAADSVTVSRIGV